MGWPSWWIGKAHAGDQVSIVKKVLFFLLSCSPIVATTLTILSRPAFFSSDDWLAYIAVCDAVNFELDGTAQEPADKDLAGTLALFQVRDLQAVHDYFRQLLSEEKGKVRLNAWSGRATVCHTWQNPTHTV